MPKNNSRPAGAAAPVKAEAPKYDIDKLRENCRELFGVSASTFAGATHGLTGGFTVAEIKAHIEKWAKEGVK